MDTAQRCIRKGNMLILSLILIGIGIAFYAGKSRRVSERVRREAVILVDPYADECKHCGDERVPGLEICEGCRYQLSGDINGW
jgi:hypothetical protein